MPRAITTEEFIKKAKAVHGDKYDYSLVDYKNCKIKIKIICPIHGVFEQTPDKHLNDKNGCKKCANEKLREDRKDKDFIQKAKEIHGDKYDYSLVDYKNAHSKVSIICKKHGVFEQLAYCHLDGGGCPSCSMSNGEEIINNYLVENNITFEIQKKFEGLVDKSYLSYDFYIPSKNLLIEFNGEQHYCWKKHLQPSYHDFLIQKHHDWLKRKYAQKHNINLLSISFKEIKNLKNILKERVIECQEQ